MAKGIWRRQGNVAVPVGAASLEYLQSIPDDHDFLAETRGARNLKQLHMWWVLCEMLADNHPFYDEREAASRGLKLGIRCVDSFLDHGGKLHFWPRSIAFESMTQEEFNPFFRKAIEKVGEWLDTAPLDIVKRFNEIVADKRYKDMEIRW